MGKLASLAALCCILLSACKKDDAPETAMKILEFGEFSLAVPSEWDHFHGQGYDSQVGGVTDDQTRFNLHGRNIEEAVLKIFYSAEL